MKFKTRLYLFNSSIALFAIMLIMLSGVVILDRILFKLNSQILSLKLQNVITYVDDSYDILKESGVENIEAYRKNVFMEAESRLSSLRVGRTGDFHIVDERGVVHPPLAEESFDKGKFLSRLYPKDGVLVLGKDCGFSSAYMCFFDTSKFGWKILLLVRKSEILDMRNNYFIIGGIVGLTALALSLFLSGWIASHLSVQIAKTLDCVKEVGRGNLDTRLEVEPFSDEHLELCFGLNSMIENLQKRETELKKALVEFGKHQKFESIAILSSGVAHDFNNLLTAIRGNVQLAQMHKLDPEARKCLDDTEKATVRAMDLTRQLLMFAKGGSPLKTTASIAEILNETASFVLRGTKSKCEFDIASDLRTVEIDVNQISQVIDNMVINANQAMPDGGVISIKAENFEIQGAGGPPLPPGNYVRISISDRGVGIPTENFSKIFDPFFTTKPNGTGLGLATSYSIIKKHEGHIELESALGKGTTFRIYLPASHKKPDAKPQAVQTRDTFAAKILVMDDQESIRELFMKMLATMGCSCETVGDGQAAVAACKKAREEGRPFDLLIMDLTIPAGMGAKEALDLVREFDPDVKAVVASGYLNDPIMVRYQDHGFKARLDKPFKIQDLKNLLSSILA